MRRFLAFCTSANLPPYPVSESTLCLFASHLATAGLKHQSIRGYLSGIRHLYISWGHPDPFANNQFARLGYVLKGIQRSATNPSKQNDRRLPILPSTLQILLDVWSADGVNPTCRMLWAACCLGFFAFLRAGEFTATQGRDPPLRPQDIAVDDHNNPSLLSVYLRHSKTDPFGKGVTLFVSRTYHPICPVAAVLSYLAFRPPIPGPLFTYPDGSPLTREQLVKHVRAALSLKGFDVSRYSGHSFRIGAATTAAARGIPDSTIQMLGRWQSSAYTRYIRTPRESLVDISRQLISQPTNNSNC